MAGRDNFKSTRDRDWKLITIIVMGVILIGIFSWIGVTYYNSKQQGFAIQNQQYGKLAGQQEILNSIQTTGYYAFDVVNQEGKTQKMYLVGELKNNEQVQGQ